VTSKGEYFFTQNFFCGNFYIILKQKKQVFYSETLHEQRFATTVHYPAYRRFFIILQRRFRSHFLAGHYVLVSQRVVR